MEVAEEVGTDVHCSGSKIFIHFNFGVNLQLQL